jgi:site-specific DNA recombinase
MKVAIYARVSSDSQDVDLSISAQLRALRDYADKHNYQIIREYVDEAESGRTADRPAFREMIALVKTKHPPFEAILVWKLNRFARNRLDSITYKALLRDRGIKIISINEPLEDTPSGHLLEGIIETVDEFYSENLGQDIRRGIRESAERGFYPGGRPPYGYRKIKVSDGDKIRYKLEPALEDSVAIKTIRAIFSLAAKGKGCKEIAKILNQGLLHTGNGRPWGATTVHKILNNEAYCGTLVWGGRPGHTAIHSDIPLVRVENAWPAIIDRETYSLVRQKMAADAPETVHPRIVPSFYLLSGLVYCSCGRAMIGRSAKSHRYYYYVCSRSHKQGKEACSAGSLPKEKLENLIIEQTKSKILTPECLEELVRLVNAELDLANILFKDKLDSIDIELYDVGIRLSKLYDALETGKLNLDDLSPRIKELKVKQDKLSKLRVQTEADMVVAGVQHVDVEIVKSYAQDLRSLLEEADFTQSKTFLRSFVKRIIIDGDKVKIQYRIPMPPDGKKIQWVGVLPITTPSGAGGIRTPYLLRAKQTFSQVNYGPALTSKL